MTKKPKPKSPTQRALADLRKFGFTPAVVERWNPHCKIRQDLFGCIDLLAIHPILGTFGIQATTGDHHAHRRVKSLAEPRLRTWLQAGNRYEIWSYAERGAFGVKKKWELRREEIAIGDLPLE